MKSIEIKGKRNIDKFKKLEDPEIKNERSIIQKWDKNILQDFESHDTQLRMINKCYLNINPLLNKELFLKEIQKKIDGYKRQDIEKELYDENYFLKFENVLQTLVESGLKCYYCKCKVYIIYSEVLCKCQWTIDRIDNDYGHNNNNIVIACYECNVRRGTMDSERFKFGKQLKLIKKE